MHSDSPPLLELRGIHKTFRDKKHGDVQALRGVDLQLRPGHCVGLVGASGSGKSTLARILLNLVAPDCGEILFDREPARVRDPRYRKNVQMIFQDPFASLNPVHTVGHHLTRAASLHRTFDSPGALRDVTVALLRQVGLEPPEEYLEKKPFALSGGQRQRVAIARALAVQPRVLVADEPTSMLDVSMRADVLHLLNELKVTQSLSMLLITHDLASARFLSDQICVIHQGVIVESGQTADVLHHPKHEYTKALLAASPQLPQMN